MTLRGQSNSIGKMTDSDKSNTEVMAEEISEPTAENGSGTKMTAEEITLAVEALVFSSPQPLPSQKITAALNKVGLTAIKNAIATLNESYQADGRSFRIRQVGGGYQYYVLPEYTEYVKRLFSRERKLRLTKAALETLAIIAYKQPVSKNQIEYIRGVACDGVIGNLLEKNLVKISGRSDGVGRSLLYSATNEFLKFFGLNTFDDLPKIAEIDDLIGMMEAERQADNAEAAEGETVADLLEANALKDEKPAEPALSEQESTD